MLPKYLELLLVLLPAAFSNMIPPLANKLFPNFNFPLDFGLSIGGQRIFGDHKTFRGLIAGVVASHVGFLIIRYFVLKTFAVTDPIYETFTLLPYLYGAYIGTIALLGDAIKSFFKRRFKVESGKPWFPFDQLDWVVASLIYISFYIDLDCYTILFALFIGLVGHLVSKVVGFIMGINKEYI